MSFSLSSTVKQYPKHEYAAMKEAILGKRYELSLVFIGTDRARTLNQQYRNKSYSPNVLSFPLSETAGEVFICPHVAEREAAKFELTPQGYVALLFIHGCLHLKGHDHGATMEEQERKYLRKFNVS